MKTTPASPASSSAISDPKHKLQPAPDPARESTPAPAGAEEWAEAAADPTPDTSFRTAEELTDPGASRNDDAHPL
jgi:hypothetical protein